MAFHTQKQQMQWRLRHALGAVTGLFGYHNNVRACIESMGVSATVRNEFEAACSALKTACAKAEAELREKITHIPKNL